MCILVSGGVGPVDIGPVSPHVGDSDILSSLTSLLNSDTLSSVGYQTMYAVIGSIFINTLQSYALPYVSIIQI